MTTEFTGKDLVLSWIYSGGTVAMNADYRSVTWAPAVDMVDTTAGADTTRTRIATIIDATATVNLVAQTDGTALRTALAAGTGGTLIIGPEGTATNKRKISMPAICAGATYEFPYADVVTISATFNANGAFTDTNY